MVPGSQCAGKSMPALYAPGALRASRGGLAIIFPEEAPEIDPVVLIELDALGKQQFALQGRFVGIADPPGSVDDAPPGYPLSAFVTQGVQGIANQSGVAG